MTRRAVVYGVGCTRVHGVWGVVRPWVGTRGMGPGVVSGRCFACIWLSGQCFACIWLSGRGFTRIWLFCRGFYPNLAVLPVFGLISGCFASFLAVWPHTRLFGLIPGCLASYPAVWPPWWYRPGLSVLRFTRSRESCSLRLRVRVVYKTSFHLEMT